MKLRDYQYESINLLRNNIHLNKKHQILMMPTGSGKTIVCLELARLAIGKGNKVLFLADRLELIKQTYEKANYFSIVDGLTIMTPQSLNNHFKYIKSHEDVKLKKWNVEKIKNFTKNYQLILVDEVHCKYSVVEEILKNNEKSIIIGLSATPFADYLPKYFYDEIVCGTSMIKLVLDNMLILPNIKIASTQLKNVLLNAKIIKGEYDYNSIEKDLLTLNTSVVEKWLELAKGRKTIIFGSTIKHCLEMKDKFIVAGVKANVYTTQTSVSERNNIVNDFKYGKLDILISVDALAKGFDVPEVSCICDCRPLRASFNTYVQMLGRATRIANNKQDALYLDFTGNSQRFANKFNLLYHGAINKLSDGTMLNKVPKKKAPECEHCKREIPRKLKIGECCPYQDCKKSKGFKCPACEFVNEKYFLNIPEGKCDCCGYFRKNKEDNSKLFNVGGEMVDFDIYGLTKVRSPLHAYQQICQYVDNYSLIQEQRRGWYSKELFKRIFGVKCPYSFRDTVREVITLSMNDAIRKIRYDIKKELEAKR